MRTFTTARYSPAEQFAAWRDAVAETFVPVDVRRERHGPFMSTVSARPVGALTVSTMTSESQLVLRTENDIARRVGDVFFLNLPLTGGSAAAQGGRVAHLAPGDFVLVDSARPFELTFAREFRQVSLTIPHDLLAPLVTSSNSVTGIRVAGDHGVGAVASAAIKALASSSPALDREAERALGERLAELIALALAGVRKAPRNTTARALLLEAAFDEIDRSLAFPELSPALVAERLGISKRYLHDLFAGSGTTFGKHLLTRRLERARRDLEDPARAHWTIAQVASERGFADPAYFSRTFKARFGLSPRELRSQRDQAVAARPVKPHEVEMNDAITPAR